MTEVDFYDVSFLPVSGLTYAVIAARHKDKWLFVRHNDRTSWEIAGGHIEKDESPSDAARRELNEETGAVDFIMDCVATYSVRKNGETGYGRLYFAEVPELEKIPDNSEIAEVRAMDHLPENLTYPDIQPLLFMKVKDYLSGR